MKPYLAILIDSFWEAIGNKVLWALLIGWSLVLIGLAPFGYITERSFQLMSSDISRSSELFQKLAKGAKGRETEAIQAVAQQLDKDFMQRLLDAEDPEEEGERIRPSEMAKQLNTVLGAEGLYSEDVFTLRSEKRRERLEPLIAKGTENLPEDELEELNRELLQLAFPQELDRPRSQQLWIGYGTLKLGEALPISKRQIREFLEPVILSTVIKLGLGVLAVFVAVVVTSPIIPDTFRSGSLHLLLSKPISRVWLYLAKFFGGCIFVLLNITFVLIGLYFIAGLRFEIWNPGLLACIPLLMFVFVIFYSVSSFVGLLWGNAIVCVVSCMIFWLFCFALGGVHDGMMQSMDMRPQIRRVGPVEDDLLAVTEEGHLVVWNREYSVWQPAVDAATRGQATTFGPLYDAEREQVLFKSFRREPFRLSPRSRSMGLLKFGDEQDDLVSNGAAEDKSELEADSGGDQGDSEKKESDSNIANEIGSISDAREKSRWMEDSGPDLPEQVFDILHFNDSIIAICRGGLFKLDLEQLEIVEQSQGGFFGIKLPWNVTSPFKEVTPDDFYLTDNTNASVTADGKGLVVYASGKIDHLVFTDEKFSVQSSVESGQGDEEDEGARTVAALVRMNDSFCVLARNGMPLAIYDSSLNYVTDVEIPNNGKVRQLSWIPDSDEFAIVTHTGEFLKLDCSSVTLAPMGTPFDGSCTSMTWVDSTHVWIGVKPSRVYLVDTNSGELQQSLIPKATIWESIFRWGVKPIYLVNPKPAALDNAMSYLLSGNRTQALSIVTNDLETAQLELDIWQPIITNLGFVVFMLGLGCFYVSRKEF